MSAITSMYEDQLATQAAEIERLTALCQEYRENGDRLMRVADEYKAEIERLNQLAVDVYKLNRESYLKLQAQVERKSAALRVALDALETAALNDPAREDDHYYDIAAGAVREALK